MYMKTVVISTEQQAEAGTSLGANILKSGGLVAFPTETVYGLGANGLDAEAVESIFEAKGRPNDNPLILHIAKKSDVKRLWAHVPERAVPLMEAFWPGPLTLIFHKAEEVPYAVTGGLETVAVRMPNDKTARALIRKADVPVAAPSANRSGRPSPTTAQHVLDDMDGRIPLILDGGPCAFGVESTVLTLVGEPTILRPGAVTREMLEAVIGPVSVSKSVLNPLGEREVAASPGMKYRHYAPDCPVYVVEGTGYAVSKRILELVEEYDLEHKTATVFCTDQTMRFYRGCHAVSMGDRNRPETLCAALFSLLREYGQCSDVILAESIDTSEAGLAFMNRLLRAAGFSKFIAE